MAILVFDSSGNSRNIWQRVVTTSQNIPRTVHTERVSNASRILKTTFLASLATRGTNPPLPDFGTDPLVSWFGMDVNWDTLANRTAPIASALTDRLADSPIVGLMERCINAPVSSAGVSGGIGPLVWSDEFTSFDTTKWTKAPGNWTDRYGIITAWDPALVTQSGSTIKLAVQKVGADWHGALITSLDKFSVRYGYFEISCKVPKGAGMFVAPLWMMPQNPVYGGWPLSGEIDILEYIGTTQEFTNGYTTLHWRDFGTGLDDAVSIVADTPDDLSLAFHTWGCLWDKNTSGVISFTLSLDGVPYGTITQSQWDKVPSGDLGSPFDQPFFFIINNTVGGAWAGPPVDANSGLFLEVDYLRVYEPPSTAVSVIHPSWSSSWSGVISWLRDYSLNAFALPPRWLSLDVHAGLEWEGSPAYGTQFSDNIKWRVFNLSTQLSTYVNGWIPSVHPDSTGANYFQFVRNFGTTTESDPALLSAAEITAKTTAPAAGSAVDRVISMTKSIYEQLRAVAQPTSMITAIHNGWLSAPDSAFSSSAKFSTQHIWTMSTIATRNNGEILNYINAWAATQSDTHTLIEGYANEVPSTTALSPYWQWKALQDGQALNPKLMPCITNRGGISIDRWAGTYINKDLLRSWLYLNAFCCFHWFGFSFWNIYAAIVPTAQVEFSLFANNPAVSTATWDSIVSRFNPVQYDVLSFTSSLPSKTYTEYANPETWAVYFPAAVVSVASGNPFPNWSRVSFTGSSVVLSPGGRNICYRPIYLRSTIGHTLTVDLQFAALSTGTGRIKLRARGHDKLNGLANLEIEVIDSDPTAIFPNWKTVSLPFTPRRHSTPNLSNPNYVLFIIDHNGTGTCTFRNPSINVPGSGSSITFPAVLDSGVALSVDTIALDSGSAADDPEFVLDGHNIVVEAPPDTITAPPQAISAGLNTLFFHDEFETMSFYHPTTNPNGNWRFLDAWMGFTDAGYIDFAGGKTFNINQMTPTTETQPYLPASQLAPSILRLTCQRAHLDTRPELRTLVNNFAVIQSQPPDQVTWLGAYMTTERFNNDTRYDISRPAYVEYRIRFSPADTQGIFSSAWLYVATAGPQVEVDVFETAGLTPSSWNTAFYQTPSGPSESLTHNSPWCDNQWHTYGILWTPTSMTIYRDNVADGSPPSAFASAFNTPMRINITHTCDPSWGSPSLYVPGEVEQVFMDIDYIRVWR